MRPILAILILLAFSLPAQSDEVDVLMVKAVQTNGLWDFDVTVHHPDASTDHMLDNIAIFLPGNVELTIAEVPKPSIGAKHVTIQINSLEIPDGVEYIVIRGHCSTSGWSDLGIIIALM
ncbi:MAG: hypothetical protein ABGW81_07530 [Paracoccaceae bacterium]